VNVVDGVKAAALLFLAAIMQVSIFAQVHIFGGVPDVLLVLLVAVALLRGAIVGAAGGFFAGLLVDTASLGRLGLTSLVLTIAGYWIGRYGETTGRDRAHAPFLSVAVVTILYSFGLLLVHFVLGERAPAGAKPGDIQNRVELGHIGKAVLAQVASENVLAKLGVRLAGDRRGIELVVELAHLSSNLLVCGCAAL